jgi:hypothetical protein
MLPQGGTYYAVQTETASNVNNYISIGMDRSLALHPGTYSIKVQFMSGSARNTAVLNFWHLNLTTADCCD